MTELHYLPSFTRDLEEIWLYVAEDDLSAADRLVSALYERCLILCEFPKAGPQRRDLAPNLRQLIEGNYIILYRVRENRIEMVRALHARRKIEPESI